MVTDYFTALLSLLLRHKKNCLIFQNRPKILGFWDGLFDICMILFNNGNSAFFENKQLHPYYLIIQSRAKKSKANSQKKTKFFSPLTTL
jgi:hypothetical protein